LAAVDDIQIRILEVVFFQPGAAITIGLRLAKAASKSSSSAAGKSMSRTAKGIAEVGMVLDSINLRNRPRLDESGNHFTDRFATRIDCDVDNTASMTSRCLKAP
jgi:hypothetical protein